MRPGRARRAGGGRAGRGRRPRPKTDEDYVREGMGLFRPIPPDGPRAGTGAANGARPGRGRPPRCPPALIVALAILRARSSMPVRTPAGYGRTTCPWADTLHHTAPGRRLEPIGLSCVSRAYRGAPVRLRVGGEDTGAPGRDGGDVVRRAGAARGVLVAMRGGIPSISAVAGAGATMAHHRGHWAVDDGGASRAVRAVSAGEGGVTVSITHEALSGTAPTPTVTYMEATDDAWRVRDTFGTPNVQAGGPFEVRAADAIPPATTALSLSASKAGASRLANEHVRADDDIAVGLTLSEPAGAPPPRLVFYGDSMDMELSGGGGTRWFATYTIPEGAAQGNAMFGVIAQDAGGAEATIGRDSLTAGNAIIDTVAPRFAAATHSSIETIISPTAPVRGTVVASDWLVGGARATGASASPGGAPHAAIPVPPPREGATQSFVLVHAPLAGEPAVQYSPRAG